MSTLATQRTGETATAMHAARQPTGAGRIGIVGPVLAVLLTAGGVVLLHDAIALADGTPGRTWLAALSDGTDGITAEWWMIPAGAIIAAAGIWLIVVALWPRSRKTLAVTSSTGVFLHTRDIARLASAAAEDVDGVLSARTVASRRTVTVNVEALTSELADAVRQSVEHRLAALSKPMRISVRVRSPRKGN